MKDGIEIIIMCRERQYEALRAIEAIKKVDFGTVAKLKVSDNPTAPERALLNIPSGVEHTVRIPGGNWNWHFNTIVAELEYEWSLITHDDDEILPELGQIFQAYRDNPSVSVITGVSQIVDHKKGPIFDSKYENRVARAGLNTSAGVIQQRLSEQLFKLGTLFPASAIIIRTTLLKSLCPLDERFGLTADFALSILISHGNGVIFEGVKPVMKYNLHDSNSVFSVEAAGGVRPDFTISRIILLDRYKELDSLAYKRMLLNHVVTSRILLSAFAMHGRRKLLEETIERSDVLKRNKLIYLLMLIPIPLGPLAPLLRLAVRKRLGI